MNDTDIHLLEHTIEHAVEHGVEHALHRRGIPTDSAFCTALKNKVKKRVVSDVKAIVTSVE